MILNNLKIKQSTHSDEITWTHYTTRRQRRSTPDIDSIKLETEVYIKSSKSRDDSVTRGQVPDWSSVTRSGLDKLHPKTTRERIWRKMFEILVKLWILRGSKASVVFIRCTGSPWELKGTQDCVISAQFWADKLSHLSSSVGEDIHS